jgi:hypothetical protein
MNKILWCVDISTAKEDRILYRGWQLELFLFSMIEKGGIKEEDICITCYVEDLQYALPDYYSKIFSLYPRVKVVFEIDIGFSPMYHTMDRGPADYCAINKSSALIPVYKEGLFEGYDTIALLDLDAYMFGKANWSAYPETTTLTVYPSADPKSFCSLTSGLQGQEALMDATHIRDLWGNPWNGIDLIHVMKAIRVPQQNIEKIKAGSYNVFIAKEDFTEEVVYGFHYFTIVIKSLCAAAGHPSVWQAEMGAYPLTLASYGVDYDTSDRVEISDTAFHRDAIPEGSICTYAFDGFSYQSGSHFNKMNYTETTPFDDLAMIKEGVSAANTDAERAFFLYCGEIREDHRIERL